MESTKEIKENYPVCTIDETALSAEQKDHHKNLARDIMGKIQEMKELPNGYSLRFPLNTKMINSVAEFVSLEQKCCSFFGFDLSIGPNNGPLWLSITGGPGAKSFLEMEMGMNA